MFATTRNGCRLQTAVEASERARQDYRYHQAARTGHQDMAPTTKLERAHLRQEQVREDEVRQSPQHVDPRRGQPLARRRRERALKRVASDAGHEMGNGID